MTQVLDLVNEKIKLIPTVQLQLDESILGGGKKPFANCLSDTRCSCHDVFMSDKESLGLTLKHLYSLLETTLPGKLTSVFSKTYLQASNFGIRGS